MTTVIPLDIYEDGELKSIEFYDMSGSFVIQAVWDDSDEQTAENRLAFRKWAHHMMKQKDYEVKS